MPDTIPVGTIFQTIRAAAPTGWLLLHGQTIGPVGSSADAESADYEALFDLIKDCSPNAGTESWAGGDKVYLPDTRGRVIGGLDNMGGSSANVVTHANADTLGGTYGDEDTEQHSHLPICDITEDGGAGANPSGQYAAAASGGEWVYTESGVIGDSGNMGATEDFGAGAAKNVQPTTFMNFMIAAVEATPAASTSPWWVRARASQNDGLKWKQLNIED